MFALVKYLLPFTKYPYVGQWVHCPVCENAESVKVASLDRRLKRLSTYACTGCGLLYTNPMPTDEELYEYYTRLYRLDYQAAASSPRARHLRKRAVEAQIRLANIKPLLSANSRTLDFGCGTGEFVTCLRAEGHDAHGFEPGHNYGHYAQTLHGQRIKIEGWQQVSYEGTFDLVSCFHVVEHLKDPVAAMQKMVQWVKPDGLVYIEVPDMGSTVRNKGFGAMHFAHLIGFNQHNLVVAAAIAGLTPKKIVSSTGIIFSPAKTVDAEALASEKQKGKELAFSLYAERGAVSRYLRYQLSKVTG